MIVNIMSHISILYQVDANLLMRMCNFRLTCENISGILDHEEGALRFFLTIPKRFSDLFT